MTSDLKRIKASFRMEMIGAGLYAGLAKQYRRQDHSLNRIFLKFSAQEQMHARLFHASAREKYGKDFKCGWFWKLAGRLAAMAMRPASLNKKLKKIHIAEQAAVNRIEAALAEGIDAGNEKIFLRILPHEKEHASLYGELFYPKPAMDARPA